MNFYIHVPFCLSKCNYCGFYSKACISPDWDAYLSGILSEIEYWHARRNFGPAKTIFFGGGTPSLMPPKVFNKIVDALNPATDCEITMESNPGAVRYLGKYKINRLSIGIQSLSDDDLRFLGRQHNAADALELIRAAQKLGLRVSADFIYGLPGQTAGDVKKLCEQINELGLEHCSMYELSIEHGTPFAKMNLQMPDNETMATMYDAIGETLNLLRYEVSNYGNPCKHNTNVWEGSEYIGLGDGAAGRVIVDNQWYETKVQCSKFNIQLVSDKNRAIEKVITGLRTTRGVKLTDDVHDVIDWEYVKNNKNLSIIDNRLAVKNFLLLDTILLSLIK